jgi:hypothetical protein
MKHKWKEGDKVYRLWFEYNDSGYDESRYQMSHKRNYRINSFPTLKQSKEALKKIRKILKAK